MTEHSLTDALAEQLGWKVAPDRFIKSGRTWLPRWRFAPLSRLDDAFLLLDRFATSYTMRWAERGRFFVEVRSGRRIGRAYGEPKSRAITLAIAEALGLGGVK